MGYVDCVGMKFNDRTYNKTYWPLTFEYVISFLPVNVAQKTSANATKAKHNLKSIFNQWFSSVEFTTVKVDTLHQFANSIRLDVDSLILYRASALKYDSIYKQTGWFKFVDTYHHLFLDP